MSGIKRHPNREQLCVPLIRFIASLDNAVQILAPLSPSDDCGGDRGDETQGSAKNTPLQNYHYSRDNYPSDELVACRQACVCQPKSEQKCWHVHELVEPSRQLGVEEEGQRHKHADSIPNCASDK
jgi:hypothetical protein